MASSPTDLPIHRFAAPDGVDLAWREMGAGRPVILIHGYFSNAWTNWIRYGHAAKVADKGFRVIMPDLRGHGESARPHDPAAYPPDVLADDGLALVAHLGLTDYDLGGYSLGGRTAARMIARGATPRRAVIAGMGLEGLLHTQGRGGFFKRVLSNLGTFARGTPEWMSEAFLKTTGGDAAALLLILNTFVDTPEADLRRFDLPVLAIGGAEDDDNGPIPALADVLPDVTVVTTPGNHMSAVIKPELGQGIADWLAG
ncbi:MAG: alpha/beta fold hydrolase [Sphingomonas sp.]